jgi:hypothetical protein
MFGHRQDFGKHGVKGLDDLPIALLSLGWRKLV